MKQVVRVKGLEPSWDCPHTDLNRTRLPIPPHPHLLFVSDLGRKQEKMIQDMRAPRKGIFVPKHKMIVVPSDRGLPDFAQPSLCKNVAVDARTFSRRSCRCLADKVSLTSKLFYNPLQSRCAGIRPRDGKTAHAF